jgi:hypothetical protein
MKNMDKVNTWSLDGATRDMICYFAEAKIASELDTENLQRERDELLVTLKVTADALESTEREWYRCESPNSEPFDLNVDCHSDDALKNAKALIARIEKP